MPDVAIDAFLSSLGLNGDAAVRARRLMEEEGLTNPRKVRISEAKLERARAAIDRGIARLCHDCAARGDTTGRHVVQVPEAACSVCGGSRHDRALEDVRAACRRAGIRRLVVVGGSPDVRRELRQLEGDLELRLVDGTARRTGAEADRDLDWADLVVVLGSSELAHKVSTLYTKRGTGTPVITASRRGIGAIAQEIVDHVARR